MAAYKAWRPTIDFAGPIDAETTALLPALHQVLLRLGLDDPLMAIFAGISRRAWYENQLLMASLRQLADGLTSAGIDCVLVGEVPLVLNHFESHGRRMERLDIVVSPDDAHRAARLLEAAGWASSGALAEEEIAYHHVKRFTGPNQRFLDLRWHFIGSAANARTDEFFRAGRQPFALEGIHTGQLSPAAALIHSLLDDRSLFAIMPARWVADELVLIGATAGGASDWSQIAEFAIETELASRLYRKLELLKHFGAPIPEAAMDRLRNAKAGLPEAADRLGLNSLPRQQKYIPLGGRGVFADYLRADRREGQPRGLGDFSHFIRHRWGLKGRREIPSLAARGIWRSLVSFM